MCVFFHIDVFYAVKMNKQCCNDPYWAAEAEHSQSEEVEDMHHPAAGQPVLSNFSVCSSSSFSSSCESDVATLTFVTFVHLATQSGNVCCVSENRYLDSAISSPAPHPFGCSSPPSCRPSTVLYTSTAMFHSCLLGSRLPSAVRIKTETKTEQVHRSLFQFNSATDQGWTNVVFKTR